MAEPTQPKRIDATPPSGTPTTLTPNDSNAAASTPSRRNIQKSLTLASATAVGDKTFMDLAAEVAASVLPKPVGDERVVKTEPPPESRLLSEQMLFDADEQHMKPNLSLLKSHLMREGRLEVSAAIKLVTRAREILQAEPNVLDIAVPVAIIGDIHGQFYDLLSMLDKTKADQYLFLGDYVDRGDFSCEVLFYLLAMKICNPRGVWLLRGNHETRMMAEFMTFQLEVDYKYQSEELYAACTELFDSFPLAAVITGSRIGTVLAVHGGIGPDIMSVDDISAIDRFREPPSSGPLCDLLWSDPVEPPDNAEHMSKYELEAWKSIEFVPNSLRQTSFMYGLAATRGFLEANGLACIIRGHQVMDDGFKEHRFLTNRKTPLVVTVFMAPNYCDMYSNKGAVANLTAAAGLEYEQLNSVPHPFYLPDFTDVMAWSLPYLMESLVSMLSELVVAIKEENASEMNEERKRRDVALAAKMKAMKMRLQEYEVKRDKLNKIKEDLLKVPNQKHFEKFKSALQLDAANEQCPQPVKKHKRAPLERTNSWVW